MLKVDVRKLVVLSPETVKDRIKSPITIVFDDGEIESSPREVYLNSLAWEFFRRHPEFQGPFLKKHHIASHLKSGRLVASSHADLLSGLMFSIFNKDAGGRTNVELDTLARECYEINNDVYNKMIKASEADVTTLDIVDLLEVMSRPDIIALKDGCGETPESLTATKDAVMEILKKSSELDDNNLAIAVRCGVVKNDQVAQCIGPRGLITDIDSNLFRTPVKRGYAEGFRRLHDSMIESRSASKSLLLAQNDLRDTEYFSRRLQLVGQNIQNLHFTDCGSEEYLHYPVRSKHDLEILKGSKYLDDQGSLSTINGAKDEERYLGTVLRVRNVIYCKHPDPVGLCSTCFGDMAYSVPSGINLGQMCATSPAQKISQTVLSTKHLDGNAHAERVTLVGAARDVFSISSDGLGYVFRPEAVDPVGLLLCFDVRAAGLLSEVQNCDSLDGVVPSQISAHSKLWLVREGSTDKPVELVVEASKRKAYFTREFLTYLKTVGWEFRGKGQYQVRLDGWDISEVVCQVPMKQFSMSDHATEIADIIEGTTELQYERWSTDPGEFLIALSDKVAEKLDCNLSVLSTVAYGYMCNNSYTMDYRLPKSSPRSVGVMKHAMASRSLSAAMAFEDHKSVILNPRSFNQTERPPHPMDAILMPREYAIARGIKL